MPQLDFFILYKMLFNCYLAFFIFHFFFIIMFINFISNFMFFDKWLILHFKIVYFNYFLCVLIFNKNLNKFLFKNLKKNKLF